MISNHVRSWSRLLFVVATLSMASAASAEPGHIRYIALGADTAAPPSITTPAPKPAAQGVAVLATGSSRDDAFSLARAVYGSSLRPHGLDELRARVLGGDPAPEAATKEVRELAELRASITGDDAASRRLLASIAEQIHVQALLVVSREAAAPPSEESADAGPAAAPAPAPSAVRARLFLAETGEFDAARYEPDASDAPWSAVVRSLSSRFPPPPSPAVAHPAGPPPKLSSEGKESKPFYLSPWLWGAIGAAVLIGGFFYFATQDTSNDPIQLRMRVPR